MELCLGTVQFGMDYGIIGQKKPSLNYAVDCLDYATQNGISAIDTAAAYGSAEEVVGAFLMKKTLPRHKLFISTKLFPNILDDAEEKNFVKIIRENLHNSLHTLHTDYVDAYLLHSARYAFRPEILEALHKMQEEGLAGKVGVSVYEPEEAEACFVDKNVGFIQAPYSIFDHRMKQAGVFEEGKKKECQIHTRSAFIQGLIALKEEQIPSFLEDARPIIRKIDSVCQENRISRIQLALAYVKKTEGISHLVFGVDSMEQLKEDIHYFQQDISNDLLEKMEKEFESIPARIVMPSLWKK